MAKRYWFKWNDVRSDAMNIILNAAPQIVKPEERIEHVTIPGRAGDLTLTEGEDIWQSYIQTVGIAVNSAANVPIVENWLKGPGRLTLSSQPGLEQDARVIGAVTLEKHSRNLDWWEGDVQFYCSPIKRDVNEQAVTITSSGTTVTNPGDMVSYPLIEITGSGVVTVMIGSKTLTIPSCTSGWVIDTENEWILDDGAPVMGACSGEFPVLNKGANVITYTGSVSKLVITPRFRYL